MPKVQFTGQLQRFMAVPKAEAGGATVRDLGPQEFSAFGVSRESGGVAFASLPARSRAVRDGFESRDLIQSVNGNPVHTVAEFSRALTAAGAGRVSFGVVRAQTQATVVVEGGVEPPRI